jgi:hypothetical protein
VSRQPNRQTCPVCGQKGLQLVETNHRQKAYQDAQVFMSCYAPNYERIDPGSVTFQAVCGGTLGTGAGCGFTGPRYTFLCGPQGQPLGSTWGVSYCQSAALAKSRATQALKRIRTALEALDCQKTPTEQRIGELLDLVDLP